MHVSAHLRRMLEIGEGEVPGHYGRGRLLHRRLVPVPARAYDRSCVRRASGSCSFLIALAAQIGLSDFLVIPPPCMPLFIRRRRGRVPPLETQCVTHAKDSRGGSIGTSTLVYRPLSTMSAISQSGAVGRGQTAATATYFCARQEVEVPPALCREVFKGFTAALDKLEAGGEWGGCTATTNTERATLELMCHLRLVLCRGAVELRPRFPDFALYKKYPFNSRLFLDWAEPALAEIGKLKGEEAAARLKSGVSPAVADELNLMSSRQEAITARVRRS